MSDNDNAAAALREAQQTLEGEAMQIEIEESIAVFDARTRRRNEQD